MLEEKHNKTGKHSVMAKWQMDASSFGFNQWKNGTSKVWFIVLVFVYYICLTLFVLVLESGDHHPSSLVAFLCVSPTHTDMSESTHLSSFQYFSWCV